MKNVCKILYSGFIPWGGASISILEAVLQTDLVADANSCIFVFMDA